LSRSFRSSYSHMHTTIAAFLPFKLFLKSPRYIIGQNNGKQFFFLSLPPLKCVLISRLNFLDDFAARVRKKFLSSHLILFWNSFLSFPCESAAAAADGRKKQFELWTGKKTFCGLIIIVAGKHFEAHSLIRSLISFPPFPSHLSDRAEYI
jgi:hypothetical protein